MAEKQKPHERIYDEFRGLEPNLAPAIQAYRDKIEKELPTWLGRYSKIVFDARLALAERYAEVGAFEKALEELNKVRQEIGSETVIAMGAEAKKDEIEKKGLRGEERLSVVTRTGQEYMSLSDQIRDHGVQMEVATKRKADLERRLAEI